MTQGGTIIKHENADRSCQERMLTYPQPAGLLRNYKLDPINDDDG